MATAQNIDSDGLSSLYESILQDYLDEDTDPATTAARYTNPTHQPIQQIQVPGGHGPIVPVWNLKLWTQLPIFGANVTEHVMNRTPDKLMEEAIRILPGYTYWNAGEMANIHSFLARVTSDGVLNFDNIALSFLGRALEEEPARASSFSTLDDHVPTAAVWILYARRCIYTNRTLWEYDEDETRFYGDMGEDRKLYDGSRGFCAERWASWKMRFEFVVACEAVKELARKIAGEALAKMVEIEGDAEMVEGPNVA